MARVSGDGPEKKGARDRPSFEAAWGEIDHHFAPEARPEFARFVRQVDEYTDAARSEEGRALLARVPHWRDQVRTEAKKAKAAVPRLFDALDALCVWSERTELVGLEPENAVAFRTVAAQVKAWWPYLIRLEEAAGWMGRHREHPGPRRNAVREYVLPEFIALVEKYRLDKKSALLRHTGTDRCGYGGVLFETASKLQLPCLPLPPADAALYSALERADRRLRQSGRRKLSPPPRNNLQP